MIIEKNGYKIFINESNGYLERIIAVVEGKEVCLFYSDAEFVGSFGSFGGQIKMGFHFDLKSADEITSSHFPPPLSTYLYNYII